MKLSRIILAVFIAACFVGGIVLGVFGHRAFASSGRQRSYDTTILLKQVQSLSELVTVKYVIERVVVLEDVKWYGDSRVLILAHGIVKAGVDLARLKPEDISVSEKKIAVRLPPMQVMDAYLDDSKTQVIERNTGLLRAFDKDLEQTARQNAIDDIRRAARLGGIGREADQRARDLLRQLIRQLGFEEIEFR